MRQNVGNNINVKQFRNSRQKLWRVQHIQNPLMGQDMLHTELPHWCREGKAINRTTEQLFLHPSLLPSLPWSPLTASADFWGLQQWAQVGVCLLWPHRPAAQKEAHTKRLHSVGIYPPGLSGYFQERCTKNRRRHGKGG